MVRPHDVGNPRVDRPADDPLAFQRVQVDLPALVRGQRPRLLEDAPVHEQLADVVQQRSLDDGPAKLVSERELTRELVGARGNRDGVMVGVRACPEPRLDEAACALDRKGRLSGRVELAGGSHSLPLSGDASRILPLS